MSQARTSARISAVLRERLDRAITGSGQSESAILKLALNQFLDAHRSPTAIIAAAVEARRKGKL